MTEPAALLCGCHQFSFQRGCPVHDTEVLTLEQYRALLKKPPKYRNQTTVVDGIKFSSKLEAKRYGELCLLVKSGAITGLELQPRYDIEINGRFICAYIADFRYWRIIDGWMVVEDCKGMATPAYVLKKKLMRAVHAVEIVEIRA